jgi:hypothetical protein
VFFVQRVNRDQAAVQEPGRILRSLPSVQATTRNVDLPRPVPDVVMSFTEPVAREVERGPGRKLTVLPFANLVLLMVRVAFLPWVN